MQVEYTKEKSGRVIPLKDCSVRFLRFTPFVTPPGRERVATFGMMIDFELRNGMDNATTASLKDFAAVAESIVKQTQQTSFLKKIKNMF